VQDAVQERAGRCLGARKHMCGCLHRGVLAAALPDTGRPPPRHAQVTPC
jgi:hypothetical protein